MADMSERDRILTIAKYVVANTDTLQGKLSVPHYFNVGGETTGERSCSPIRTMKGYAVDIVADLIERGEFFGWFIDVTPDKATASGNAKVYPLANKEGRAKLEFDIGSITETEEGLKDMERFLRYSEIVDFGENAEENIRRLFSSE